MAILPNVIELAYYSNTMLLHYVMDSVVVTAMSAAIASQIKNSRVLDKKQVTVTQRELVENALAVCDILKYEFIFCKPCQDLEEAVVAAIGRLVESEVICVDEVRTWFRKRWIILLDRWLIEMS